VLERTSESTQVCETYFKEMQLHYPGVCLNRRRQRQSGANAQHNNSIVIATGTDHQLLESVIPLRRVEDKLKVIVVIEVNKFNV
jgi:hypothetical protein